MANSGDAPVTLITAEISLEETLSDLRRGFAATEQWLNFAWHEVRQRFKRSVLGPFWITLSMGILVAALGTVFAGIFKQDISTFLPYLTTGLIFWGLITSVINEGANMFITSAGYLKDVAMPVSIHFYRMLARNLIVWLHNMAIYVLVFVVFIKGVNLDFVWFVPGFALFVANLAWMGLFVGIISTRFRDIPQVISNLLQVIFFITPVFWSLESFPDRPHFVTLNPIYHLIEIVRSPLLGQPVNPESWLAALGMAIIGSLITFWLFSRTRHRIALWV